MSEITDLLSEINIPKDKAVLLEHALDKKYVARPGFPPLDWEKANMIPIQQEQIKASERIESLRMQMFVKFDAMDDRLSGFKEEMHARFEASDEKMNSFKEEVRARFDAIDSKFGAMDSKFGAMDSKFGAIDSKFAAMDDKYKMLMWMNGILMAMAFAMFSKMFFGF